MPLSSFVKASADRQEAIELLTESLQPTISRRFQELVNEPDQLNAFIMEDFLLDGRELMVNETGNEQLADAYWDQVADMVQYPLDFLAETPVEQRSSVWNDAASLIVSVAQIQAEIESGLFERAAEIGVESGAELSRLSKGIPKDKLKTATFNIKPELAARKKAKRDNSKRS